MNTCKSAILKRMAHKLQVDFVKTVERGEYEMKYLAEYTNREMGHTTVVYLDYYI